MILAIGNYLNGGTPRGAAFGFSFDTLNKVIDLKSTDGTINLVHFIVG